VKNLDHPNIIRLIEVIEEEKRINLVTELCTGGDLLQKIVKTKVITENLARNYS